MPLIGKWLRLELRRRWRSLLVLTLLVALSAGVVLTAVAGARRGASALDRLGELTLPATAGVLANQPGFDWDAVRALPGVAAVAEFAVTTYRVGDIPVEAFPDGFPMDRAAMDTVERPVVLAGRLADPDRADEAVVTAAFVRTYGLGVGDVVDLRLYSPEQIDTYFTDPVAPEPAGPVVPTTIVGVVRSFWFSDRPGATGQLQPSAGFTERYRAELYGGTGAVFVNALVRLTDGAGLDRFRADVAAVSGRDDIEMFDQPAEADRVRRTTTFESGSLLAFGLAALAAAVVLVGQAVVRYVSGAVADLAVLRAVGLDRRTALGAAVAAPALAGVLGAGTGAALAFAASPWFPLGTAAAFEPAPGPVADPLVLGPGAAALALLVVAGAAGSARIALAARAEHPPRRSAVATLAARAGLPVPVDLGIRFALEPGRGHSALPVRPALVGAVTGVLGVLAAFTFSAGVTDAAANPARFGQTHQLELFSGENGVEYGPAAGELLAPMLADPDVVAALDARNGVLDVAAEPVTVFTHAPVGPAEYPTVLTEGRMARADDEIVLAPRTAEELGAAVGDRLPVTGGAGPGAEVTVTGVGFVPYAGHNNYDDGAWLSAAGFDRFVEGFKFHFGYVALRPGADADAVAPRLAALAAGAVGGAPTDVAMRVSEPLVEAAQIRNVEVLPLVLGGFLALLAVGAVGHALATAVRRRRHDVAVLRALGMTRRQARGVVVTQATVLATVGLVFGVPLGLALGRVLWRVVADLTPLQYQAPVALLALLLAAPVAVVVANALAAWPGHLAARLRIAHVLRAE